MENCGISVIIGTLNEEEQIRDCLDSVKEIADEIIVVDSISTDKTVDICSKYTDKIYIRPYERYARTRNWMLQFVENEWVLSIDADERFSPELLSEMKFRLEKDKHGNINGYLFPYKYVCFGREMRYWKNKERHLRLFRKEKARWEDREVHAKLIVEGEHSVMENYILHLPYRNFANVRDKLPRYTQWDAEERFKHQKSLKWYRPFMTLFKPIYNFFRFYIINQNYKDGLAGFLICFFMSYYTAMVDVKHYRLVLSHYLKKKNF